MLAAGVGCRAHCDIEDLVSAIRAALENSGCQLVEVHAIYAPDFKKDERCMSLIADRVGKALILLPVDELAKFSSFALTSSERVLRRFGLPSIAETAALAGARALSHASAAVRLVGPRTIRGGATCALAAPER